MEEKEKKKIKIKFSWYEFFHGLYLTSIGIVLGELFVAQSYDITLDPVEPVVFGAIAFVCLILGCFTNANEELKK